MPRKKNTNRAFSNIIKVQDLRMLVALDDHGTILNAANIMDLSQPAITKRLQDLERDLGVTLFHRMSRGVEPTPYGEIIIKYAHTILNQLRSAEGEVSDLADGLGGRLAVGIPVSASTDLVSEAIVDLLERRKNVQVTLVEDYNIRLIPSLKRGDLDLIVGRLPKKTQFEDINIEPFYKESLQIVVRNDHPLAKKKRVSPKELGDWHWLMPPHNSAMHIQLENFFRKKDMKMPTTSVYSLSHAGSLKVVKNQNLIATFPSESIADEVKAGNLKVLNIDLSSEATEVGIITRQSGFNSPATEMFMDIIRKIGKTK